MKEGKRISVIIPTLNEEKNLEIVLRSMPRYIDEVIVVDGNSTDDTIAVAKRFKTKVIKDSEGKGSALIKGMKIAKGDIIITMDADCSNSEKELPLLIEGINVGHDICMGSRFIAGGGTADMPLYRKLGNKFFVGLVNIFWNQHYTDLCYGYRSFRRGVPEKLNLKSKNFSIETEISIKAAKKGLSVIEVPSFEKKRVHGQGKLRTFSDGFHIMKKIMEEVIFK
jgi:glycosyltransferase involved in cell wall biosynthesis